MAAERLQKLLARAGVSSRRAAEQLIVGGRVTVNGALVTELGSKADPARDDVRLDGERLRAERPVYVLLHKPPGVMTTLDDPEGRPTVRRLVPAELGRIFPVGRLDFHSAGLLLMTNDGDLAGRLLHPRSRIPRTYRVKVTGRPTPEALARLRRGVRLEDGTTGPAEVEVEEQLPRKTWLKMTIREGRRREIRRMCEAVGHSVDRLVRVRFGPLGLGRLAVGEWRMLEDREVAALAAAVDLERGGTPAAPPRERRTRAAAKAARPRAAGAGGRARRGRS